MSTSLSQGSVVQPKTDTSDFDTDFDIHRDLEKFKKTTFTLFLHHALSLVNAVPKTRTDYPPAIEEIQKHLEICLRRIIAAMEDENNKAAMKMIDEELNKYCLEYGQTNRREAFVKTANAALILLQPLTIGNSTAAVNPEHDDFLLFMMHNPALDTGISDTRKGKLYEDLPDISCATRKNIMEVYSGDQDGRSVESEQLLEDLASQSEPDRFLEWKHHHSCWESLRAFDSLKITRPASYNHNQDYPAIALKEHGHANFDETSNGVHPINAEWCAKDAANVFYDTFGRDHIMNVAIDDDLLRVWYFDHESLIQTSAFNFIEDLPYFFLFLFAMQRFSPTNWGYIDLLYPVNSEFIESVNLSEDVLAHEMLLSDVDFRRVDEKYQAFRHLSLCGRATRVIYGNLNAGGKDCSVVLKLSWRERVRFPEGAFIQEARKRLQERNIFDVCDYLPTLLADRDFPELSTDTIRRKLMIPIEDDSTRLPYFIVVPRYEPITVRTKDWPAFFDDYMALIYCHLMLWSVGIEHRDISDTNLMWDPQTKKPKLCDFNLSQFSDREQFGFGNTGTWMFMPFDLLGKEAMEGRVKRLYRHDLESYVAVLIWIMLGFEDGAAWDNPELSDWNSSEPQSCKIARENTYYRLPKMDCPKDLDPVLWDAATEAAAKFQIISTEWRALRNKWRKTENMGLPDYLRQRYRLLPEEETRLKYLESTTVITDILACFTIDRESISSQMIQEITQKITARVLLKVQ